MSEVTLESQLFEIIKDEKMPEHIKLAKLEMLVVLGVDVNAMYGAKSALFVAKERGDEAVCKFMEANGAIELFDKEKSHELSEKLLSRMSYSGITLDEAKELIEQGGDVNAKDENAATVLIVATEHKSYGGKILELLIEKGADVNQKNNEGLTALMAVSRWGQIDDIELFISKGADVNAKDKYGNTALMWAAQYGEKEALSLLISKGADIDAINNLGNTALMKASDEGYKGAVKLLVLKGADVNQKNSVGQTAIDLAENEEIKGILNKKVQELAEKNKSIFEKIKGCFGVRE